MLQLLRNAATFLKRAMLILVIGGVALGLYLYHNLENEIRVRIEQKLAAHYEDLHVSIRSARLVEGQGLEIRGMLLGQRDRLGRLQEIISVDEVIIQCNVTPQGLMKGDFEIQQVLVKRPRMVAVLDENRQLNLRKLFPLPRWSEHQPPIHIWDGSLVFEDRLDGSRRTLLENVDLQFTTHRVENPNQPGEMREETTFRGLLRGKRWDEGRVVGTWVRNSGMLQLQGEIQKLAIHPSLWEILPREYEPHVAELQCLTAKADLNFSVVHAPGRPVNFKVKAALSQGTWKDERLPFNIEEIAGVIEADPAGLSINRLQARYRQGWVTANLRRPGWESDASIQVNASFQKFVLDSSLALLLPRDLAQSWRKYNPSGLIDATVKANFDGVRWKPELSVTCLGTNFLLEEFPYPVSDAEGTIHYKDDHLQLDLQARGGGSRVTITSSVSNPGPNAVGTSHVKSIDPLVWDETLEDALRMSHPEVLKVAREFQVGGAANIEFTLRADGGNQAADDKLLVVDVVDGELRYEKFPYPISRIRGRIICHNDVTHTEDLEGFNGQAHVVCDASWRKLDGDSRGKLVMDFVCKDVPLDEDLRTSVPPATRHVWEKLRPRGTIDHMRVHLNWPLADGGLDLKIEAQKWEKQRNVAGRPMSLEPVAVPYSLNEVVGRWVYENGSVQMLDLSARHGEARFSTAGHCYFSPAGSWRIDLAGLRIENLVVNRDLYTAMPDQMAEATRKLQLQAPLHAEGTFSLSAESANAQPVAQWDLTTHLAGAMVHRGEVFNHMYGSVRLQGIADHQGPRASGELMIDAMTYRDIPVTEVRGPVWISGSELLFGKRVPNSSGNATRRVTGQVFGGMVALDAIVQLSGEQAFQVDVNLQEANLGQMLLDLGQPNRGKNTGRIDGHLVLSGTTQGSHTYDGSGQVRLRDANLYQLPLAVSLFKVLNARFPNTTAFNSGDLRYRVQGDYVYLDEIKLAGDALSVRGNGEVTLSGDLGLRFYTEFANQTLQMPVIRTVLGEASRQLLVIHVQGTLNDPQTQQEIFP
ncbi:MAG: AsmA-like C-terminal domain-containing protein, partial [Pirellulaceae bacterium]